MNTGWGNRSAHESRANACSTDRNLGILGPARRPGNDDRRDPTCPCGVGLGFPACRRADVVEWRIRPFGQHRRSHRFRCSGGAVCNGTLTTRAWYHRPGQTWVQHAAFVAPHLAYVIVVAALLRGGSFDGRYALTFSVGLVGASAVILCAPDRLKTPVAFSAYLVVLCSITIGVGSTPAMGWFEPALLLKLLLGHLLPNGIPPTKAV